MEANNLMDNQSNQEKWLQMYTVHIELRNALLSDMAHLPDDCAAYLFASRMIGLSNHFITGFEDALTTIAKTEFKS